MKGKSARGRRYSVVENRDMAITKAVAFVLKRSIRESEIEEEDEEDEERDKLISDEEGWVSLIELLEHAKMTDLGATLVDLRRIGSETTKARYTIRQAPGSDSKDAASYQIRGNHKRDSFQAPILKEPLTLDTADLPEFIVFDTSYEAYPHIVADGTIQKAAGASHISFWPVTEARPSRSGDADISIWVHLPSAMDADPSLLWYRTTSGGIATSAGEVPKRLWKKAVARRPDVGLLFEDGEIRNEVPEALRGKGAKGKAKKARAVKSREEDASDSASDE